MNSTRLTALRLTALCFVLGCAQPATESSPSEGSPPKTTAGVGAEATPKTTARAVAEATPKSTARAVAEATPERRTARASNDVVEALLAEPAPTLAGPLASVSMYMTLEAASAATKLTDDEPPQPGWVKPGVYSMLGDDGQRGKRIHSVQVWLPDDVTPETIESKWGPPRVARSASGTFYTWINEPKQLRATYWKNPHNPDIDIARLMISEWLPIEQLLTRDRDLVHWLGADEAELRRVVGNRFGYQNEIYHRIMLGATGADSRIHALLLHHHDGKVDEVRLDIGYDEDPALRPAVEAYLADQYGAPRVDATPGSIVHTYEGEGVTVALRIHEHPKALVIEVERTSSP